MARPNYSGNLLRSFTTANDVRSGFYPDAGHGGGAHGEDSGEDPYRRSRQVPADTGAEYEGTTMPVDMVVGGGLVLDTPAYTGPDAHQGAAWLGPVYSDDQFREMLTPIHDGDGEGAYLRATFIPPAVQSRGEFYDDQVTEGFLIAKEINVDALTRGINAHPNNNPEREGYTRGVRPGLFRQLTYRITRLQHRRRSVYDAQPLVERDFLIPTNTDPQAAPEVGPVLPAWLPPRVFHRETIPALWRRPEELDADQLAQDPVSESSVITGDMA